MALSHPHVGIYPDLFNEIKTEQFQVVTGACMLVKKDTVTKIDLLDEGFINGYEDVDFCFRANSKGLKVFLAHKSKVYYYESISKRWNDYSVLNHNLLGKNGIELLR